MANKLYRSRNNRWIAGVCGGLAEFFGLSPKIVRIICALLIMVYGSGLIIYIILALFIPKEP
jgi:phage shock protein C, pspC